jgi:hypothetical protein
LTRALSPFPMPHTSFLRTPTHPHTHAHTHPQRGDDQGRGGLAPLDVRGQGGDGAEGKHASRPEEGGDDDGPPPPDAVRDLTGAEGEEDVHLCVFLGGWGGVVGLRVFPPIGKGKGRNERGETAWLGVVHPKGR